MFGVCHTGPTLCSCACYPRLLRPSKWVDRLTAKCVHDGTTAPRTHLCWTCVWSGVQNIHSWNADCEYQQMGFEKIREVCSWERVLCTSLLTCNPDVQGLVFTPNFCAEHLGSPRTNCAEREKSSKWLQTRASLNCMESVLQWTKTTFIVTHFYCAVLCLWNNIRHKIHWAMKFTTWLTHTSGLSLLSSRLIKLPQSQLRRSKMECFGSSCARGALLIRLDFPPPPAGLYPSHLLRRLGGPSAAERERT